MRTGGVDTEVDANRRSHWQPVGVSLAFDNEERGKARQTARTTLEQRRCVTVAFR